MQPSTMLFQSLAPFVASRIVEPVPLEVNLEDSLTTLLRRRDTMNTLDLSTKIEELATRQRADQDHRRWKTAELRVVSATTEIEFSSSLQQVEHCVDEQRQVCAEFHLERVHAGVALCIGLSEPWGRLSSDARLLSMNYISYKLL